MLSSGRDCGEPATTTVLKRKSGTRQRENLEFIRVDAGPGKKTAWAVDRVGKQWGAVGMSAMLIGGGGAVFLRFHWPLSRQWASDGGD